MTSTPSQNFRSPLPGNLTRRTIRTILSALAALLGALTTPHAHADGCAMPPVAVKKLPEIPTQRAVLTYRDGMERMVIESTFNGPGERLGWVIPVPAEPTRFESLPAGFAGQLEFITRPSLQDANRRNNLTANFHGRWICAISFLMLIWVLIAFCRLRFTLALALVIALPLSSAVFNFCDSLRTPHGKNGSASVSPDIQAERQERVGNYAIEVLKAKDAKALNAWLSGNGFAGLPAEGERIVERLIGEGWRFVTAKLQRKGTEPCRPHPIALTFSTKQLVYPMRLTALAGAPVRLEIFTVADGEAACGSLTTEFCDKFEELPGDYYAIMNNVLPRELALVDHAAQKFEMWPECWVTRLTGTLTPAHMQSDLAFEWKAPQAYRKREFTPAGAANQALAWALLFWCSGSIYVLLYYKAWDRIARRKPFLLASLIALGGAALSGCVVFAALPKVEIIHAEWSQASNQYDVDTYFHLTDSIESEEATRPALLTPKQFAEKFGLWRRYELEFIDNADGSLDYLVRMPDGALWGNRLRQPKPKAGDMNEEELNKMLDALNAQ